MRDFRKFCRPKFTKIPKLGDIIVKLKCGEIKVMTQDEYIKVQKFFNIYSFVGESSNSSGNIVVVNKETGKKAIFSSDDYNSIKNEFDIVDIVGNKQNPFNNHEYVDLGLPSGTLWATMNVGATSEGKLGDYYKFGETTVYDGTDYNTSAYDLAEDLPLENDVANVNWSGDWHIPTRSQWDELISNTTHTYISDYNSSGINVIKFAKTNDSSTFIILPAGGSYTDGEQTNPDTAYYWSNTQYYKSAYYTVFTQNSYFHIDWKTAYGHGFQVRPVCDSIESQRLAQTGDIICYNSLLDINSIFTYSDWLELDDNWEFVGIYGITTYTKSNTIVGDICIKQKSNKNIKIFIKPSDYSLVNTEQWEFVGITAIESRNMSDSKVRILSLDYMDYNNPTTGNSGTGVSMMWGGSENIDISYKTQVPYVSTDADNQIPTEQIQRVSSYGCIPTDYFNSIESTTDGYGYWIGVTNNESYIGKLCPPAYLSDGSLNPNYYATEATIPGTSTVTQIANRLSDFNGESNTAKILTMCTVEIPIDSSENGNYPAAQCCSLYSKGELNWYLPAEGELGLVVSNFSKLNLSRTTIGYSSYNYSSYWFWSSTPSSQSGACFVGAYGGGVSNNTRSLTNSYSRVLALCAF